MSPEDIRQVAIAEVAEGGLDPAAVRALLKQVLDHVATLEAKIVDSDQARAAALEVLSQAETLVNRANARSAEAEAKRAAAEAYVAKLEQSASQRLNESTAAATEILQRAKNDAEGLIAAAQREVEVLLAEARERAEELQGAARAKASEIEAAGAGVLAAAEEEKANVVASARASADELLEEAAARAEATVAEAESHAAETTARAKADATHTANGARAGAESNGIEMYARGLEEAAAIRTKAERTLEHARVEAAVVVARAREEADAGGGHTAAAAGQAEVGAMVAEAELLLHEARDKAEAIVADARTQADELKDRKDLSDEIHRSIDALAAVSAARQTSNDSSAATALRGRALEMVGEVSRINGELSDEAVATMRREVAEVRGILARLEAALGEPGGISETGTEAVKVVLDLTDRTHPQDAEPRSQRPSRYQQRSANLPSMGSDVDDVTRAVQSLRDQLTDDAG